MYIYIYIFSPPPTVPHPSRQAPVKLRGWPIGNGPGPRPGPTI